MLVGVPAQSVGRGADSEYWIINRPDGRGQCWLWDEYATVTGDTSKIPIMTPPPPPVITPEISVTIGPLSNGQCPIPVTGKHYPANMPGEIWLIPCPGGLCGDDDLRSFPNYTTNASGVFSISVYEDQEFFNSGTLWVEVYSEEDATTPIASKTLMVECK